MTILLIKIPSFVKLFLTKYCFSPLYISIVLLVLEYLHIVYLYTMFWLFDSYFPSVSHILSN